MVRKREEVQGIHKRMVRFQKIITNVFLALQGHNIHCQQRELSMFPMHYQQFSSLAYCGAVRPVSKMTSQQEKSFCVLRFEVFRSVATMQQEFRAHFKKDLILVWCITFKPCTKLTLHCNHKSGHFKTEHTESLLALRNKFFINFLNITILLCMPCMNGWRRN
jgi:hypothetical protein